MLQEHQNKKEITNPSDIKFVASVGIDLPIMYIYLAGYMSGDKLRECIIWRKQIRNYFGNWKNTGKPYPLAFLDPFNGAELETIDKLGLKSSVPSKGIVYGDYLSVTKADLLVVNWDTFGAERQSIGTPCEMAWAWLKQKPIITIINKDDPIKDHPFIKEFTTIFVNSVEELLEQKHLNTFYKRFAGAIY